MANGNGKSLEAWIWDAACSIRGDYVIVHELLHFSVPNHGKLWKSLMRAHLGEYEKATRRLQELGAGKEL